MVPQTLATNTDAEETDQEEIFKNTDTENSPKHLTRSLYNEGHSSGLSTPSTLEYEQTISHLQTSEDTEVGEADESKQQKNKTKQKTHRHKERKNLSRDN